MKNTTVLFAVFFVGTCLVAQRDSTTPIFVCNLKAISAADRPRHSELAKHLRAAIRDRSEISNGYTFQLDSQTVTLADVAEWISRERLCCPFLTLQISASGDQPQWLLTLTGPKGVKPLLEAEFPAH